MRKMLKIQRLVVLCGLVMLAMLISAGSVHASSTKLQPVQVQNTGYTDSQGMITVTASCPANFHIQSGTTQVNRDNQDYAIQFNGPNAQNNVWTTTITNKSSGSLSVTVTATCAENNA